MSFLRTERRSGIKRPRRVRGLDKRPRTMPAKISRRSQQKMDRDVGITPREFKERGMNRSEKFLRNLFEATQSREWEMLLSISYSGERSVLAEAIRVYKDHAGCLRFVLAQNKKVLDFVEYMERQDDTRVDFKVRTHSGRSFSAVGHITASQDFYELLVDGIDKKDEKVLMDWVVKGIPT